ALPELLKPLSDGAADAVFGSRMLSRGAARQGGMPLYKFVGNKILTWVQNRLLRTQFSEFHSGYRVYSVAALKKIPFDRNTNDFHFDTEIIIQLLLAGLRIRELPIPTYYGDESCHVNGVQYAWNVVKATCKSRLHEMSLFYDSKYDCRPGHESNVHYRLKIGYDSPHAAAVDMFALGPDVRLMRFIRHDLNDGVPALDLAGYDYVLLLDVIEHLNVPEIFFDRLREAMKYCIKTKLIISTPNVGFFIVRAMLLLGQFNYGKRGILDMTHTRLFTFSSLRQLLEQRGFRVAGARGIPAPFPMALGDGPLARFLLAVNQALIRLLPRWFSYQMFL